MNIKKLQRWLKQECFNKHSYAIGIEPNLFEGFGLKFENGKYIWYYTERGKAEILETFTDEHNACEFAFNQIKNDKYGKSHLVGLLESESLKDEFCYELISRNIEFETSKIHYQEGIYKYRIFVFGCNYKKVEDLKEKYEQLEANLP